MKYLIVSFVALFSFNCQAEKVENTKITRLYTQSLHGSHKSTGHAIAVDKPIDSSCGYRLYIDPLDKEIFATLLAYKLSDTKFNFMYFKGESAQTIAGHLMSTCKLFSIY